MADDQLERELTELGRRLDVPPTPDLTYAVREALAGDTVRGSVRDTVRDTVRVGRRVPLLQRVLFHRPTQAAAGVCLTLVAVLAGTPQGRAAVTDVLEFAGIELRTGPAPAPVPAIGSPLPGQEVTPLDEARDAVDFQIYVPASLGEPAAVTVADGRIVSLLYEAGPGRNAIIIDQFAGSITPVFQKYVDGPAEPVRVGPYDGFWISEPHPLLYVKRDGEPDEQAARMAEQTLIWQVGGTALRMEGDLTREEALEIARSMG